MNEPTRNAEYILLRYSFWERGSRKKKKFHLALKKDAQVFCCCCFAYSLEISGWCLKKWPLQISSKYASFLEYNDLPCTSSWQYLPNKIFIMVKTNDLWSYKTKFIHFDQKKLSKKNFSYTQKIFFCHQIFTFTK